MVCPVESQLIYQDPVVRISATGPLLVAVWREVPGMPQMRALIAANDSHRALLAGGKQAFINIVLSGTPRFSEEVRAETAHLIRRASSWRCATAHVIQTPGLKGVAIRTFMNTAVMVARPTVPTRVFADIGAAARWLPAHLPARAGQPLCEAEVLGVLQRSID